MLNALALTTKSTRSYYIPFRIPQVKTLSGVGEDVEKLDLSYLFAGNVK